MTVNVPPHILALLNSEQVKKNQRAVGKLCYVREQRPTCLESLSRHAVRSFTFYFGPLVSSVYYFFAAD
jgi:hypothetical protein